MTTEIELISVDVCSYLYIIIICHISGLCLIIYIALTLYVSIYTECF